MTLDALSPDEIAARLTGSPEDRAAFLREAAEAGVAEAQALYGQLLLDGDGVGQDQPAAVRWFRRTAQQGHVMAVNMLGRCHDLGWGVAVDKARAADYYEIAAGQGLDWAMYNLATLLAVGDGVAEDRPRALELLRRAADLTGNAKAINFIGSFHEDGWVVPRDMAEAARLYAAAAEAGDFRAMFNHARMLLAAVTRPARPGGSSAAPPRRSRRFGKKRRTWLRARGHPALALLIEIDSH